MNEGNGLPPQELRDALAAAVHGAVRAARGGDGYGRCAEYAFAGALACRFATGGDYVPQVGSCDLLAVAGPPEQWFHICGEGDGLARGEFHCWVVRVGPPVPGRSDGARLAAEWVDFSARHYLAMYERMPAVERLISQDGRGAVLELSGRGREPWTAPDPPPYLWHEGESPPRWAVFRPDHASNLRLMGMIHADRAGYWRALSDALADRLRPLQRLRVLTS